MKSSAAIILIALLAGNAAAASRLVQSGEHSTFSRLVFPVLSDQAWEIRQVDSRAVLRLSEQQQQFDLSQIFSFIPRSRIQDVSQDGNAISIGIACKCHVRAFFYRSNFLVVDIVDGETENGIIFHDTKPRFSPYRSDGNMTFSIPLGGSRMMELVPLNYFALNAQNALPIQSANRGRSIGKSTSIGRPEDPAVARPSTDNNAAKRLGIKTSHKWENNASELMNPHHDRCHSDHHFQISSWGFGSEAPNSLPLREDESGVTTDVNSIAALEHAKQLTYFGFGAEAIAIIGDLSVRNAEADAIMIMSQVIDNAYMPAGTDNDSECGGLHGKWARISEHIRKAADFHSLPSDVHQFIALLPGHLQERLLDQFYVSSTTAATKHIETGEKVGVGGNMPDAALSQNNAALAEAQIHNANTHIYRHVPMGESQRHLDILLERAAGKSEISAADREAIEALLQDNLDTPIGEDFILRYVDALSMSGHFQTAIDFLDRLASAGEIPTEAIEAPLTQIIDVLNSNGKPETLLDGILRITSSTLSDAINKELAQTISWILYRVNLGPMVEALGLSANVEPDLRRVLSARRNLENGLPLEAAQNLVTLEIDQAKRTRAEAFIDLGQPELAIRLFEGLEDDDLRSASVWLAEDFKEVLETNTSEPRLSLARNIVEWRNQEEWGEERLGNGGSASAVAPLPFSSLKDLERTVLSSGEFRNIAKGILTSVQANQQRNGLTP